MRLTQIPVKISEFMPRLRSPVGGSRPKWEIPVYGLGTPLLTALVLRATINKYRLSNASTLYKIVIKVAAFVISIAAFVPLVLSTVVAHSIIKSQDLWLKP